MSTREFALWHSATFHERQPPGVSLICSWHLIVGTSYHMAWSALEHVSWVCFCKKLQQISKGPQRQKGNQSIECVP